MPPKTVFISGCWDLFHIGHLNVLKQAKELGDVLVVGVITDEFARTYKGQVVIPFEQRRQIVEALRCVDATVPFRDLKDYEAIEGCGTEIRVVGPEHGIFFAQQEGRRELERRGIKYVVVPRTPNISTTKIKEVCCETLVACGNCPRLGCSGVCGP